MHFFSVRNPRSIWYMLQNLHQWIRKSFTTIYQEVYFRNFILYTCSISLRVWVRPQDQKLSWKTADTRSILFFRCYWFLRSVFTFGGSILKWLWCGMLFWGNSYLAVRLLVFRVFEVPASLSTSTLSSEENSSWIKKKRLVESKDLSFPSHLHQS